jgi:hypothetical protein
MTDASHRHGPVARALPLVALTAIVLFALWPLVLHAWDHVVDTRALYGDLWPTIEQDLWLQMWILSWDAHILPIAPWSLYEANAFHPTPSVLARSDHLLGILPIYAPVYYVTGNPVFAFQVAMIASYLLAGYALYALLRYAGCGVAVSLGVAVLWALMPWRVIDALARAQLLHYQYLPLLVLWLDRYLERGRLGDLALATLFLAWQCLTTYWHAYFAVFSALATIVASGALVASPARTRRVGASLLALAAVLAAFALLSLPYLDMARDAELVPKAAPAALWWYVSPMYFHPAVTYAALLAAIFLVIDFVRSGARDVSRASRLGVACIAIAAAGVLLSLPGYSPDAPVAARIAGMPRTFAEATVPGFRYLRDGYRFLMLASFGIYVLAALGLDAGARVLRRRSAVVAGAALIVFFVVAGSALARIRVPVTPALATDVAPPVYRWLAANGEGGTVLELPISRNLADAHLDAAYMFYSTYHWLPLINGYTGHPPRAFYAEMRQLAARLPDEEAIRALVEKTGLRWIVIHGPLYEYFGSGGWGDSTLLREIGDFDGDYLVEVAR